MQRPFVVLACGLQGFYLRELLFTVYIVGVCRFFSQLYSLQIYTMEKMRNILYICIMLLGIMCFVGCNDCHGNKKLLAQTDSLLQSRPDSALKLLNSIEKDVGFSEAEWMQFVWNCAQARYRMGMSLAEDSLLPEAIHYYRERKDSSRMLDGYLLEASYYKWMKQEERMDEAIENGLDYAIARKDTFWLLLFYRGKAEIAYLRNDHSQAIELMEKILQYADKLSVRETLLHTL